MHIGPRHLAACRTKVYLPVFIRTVVAGVNNLIKRIVPSTSNLKANLTSITNRTAGFVQTGVRALQGRTGPPLHEGRIKVLDGFRCIAILSVIFYHFFYRFRSPGEGLPAYPYEPISLVKYGYFGVQFFFVISGFVIYQSMEKTETFSDFLQKRAIRLLPSLVVCSLVTLLFVEVADTSGDFKGLHSQTLLNFLPSITLIPPAFWNFVLQSSDIGYIDGVYWSLWAEIVFYFSAACLFYYNRKNFVRLWLLATLSLICLRVLTSPKMYVYFPDQVDVIFGVFYRSFFFFNINYWVYFTLGIFFCSLYKKQRHGLVDWSIVCLLTLSEFYFIRNTQLIALFISLILLFVIFIRRPSWLTFLESRIVVVVGLVSYPLYLIHENVGLMMIHGLANVNPVRELNVYLPLIIAVLLIGFSYCVYIFVERPAMRVLLRLRFGERNAQRSGG